MEVNSDTYEEYELPSDDPGDEKEHTDSDSTVDVSIHHKLWQYSNILGKILLVAVYKKFQL